MNSLSASMITAIFPLALIGSAAARNFFTITIHAPMHPQLTGKAINARDRSFIIGDVSPSTHCGLNDVRQCPAGDSTLVTSDMSFLASAVPGGQFIYVAPDGSISYPSAHSSLRPPGAQTGGFYSVGQIAAAPDPPATILKWQSNDGSAGLWACPASAAVPVTQQAVLKAATTRFHGSGCLAVDGVEIRPAGTSFGAWEYT